MTETLVETRQQAEQQRLTRATFPNMLERFKSEIARALPRHLNPDRMCRIALTEFRKNPKLAECDPRSVFAAIIIASQLGLEPGVLGQAYLIPYKNECQLIPGYQGLIDLVRRSGMVQRIEAHVVRHGEKFTYKSGLHTVLEHEPMLEGTPGAPRLAYAVAEFREGGYHVEVMTQDQIETIRNRSQGYINAKKYNKPSPWETDTEEMWRKTVLRRICKYLPKSPEIATALSLDDAAAQGRQAITVQDAIEGTWQAPVLEVTTQDESLAAKSADNLEKIKENYAPVQVPVPTGDKNPEIEVLKDNEPQRELRVGPPPPDPERAEKLRAEAERQLQAVAEKYGAQQQVQPESPGEGDTAPAAAETTAAPSEKQEETVATRHPTGDPPAEAGGGASSGLLIENLDSEPPDPQLHGVPLNFEEPQKKKKR